MFGGEVWVETERREREKRFATRIKGEQQSGIADGHLDLLLTQDNLTTVLCDVPQALGY